MTKKYSVLVEFLVNAENEELAREMVIHKAYEKMQLYAGDGSVICMDDLITNEVSHES